MKLSDAIVLGSTIRPQCFNSFVTRHGTCAMGAALEAVEQLKKPRDHTGYKARALKIWPWLKWKMDPYLCPICQFYGLTTTIFDLTIHLNDEHHLKRAEIAQMIASIEVQAIEQIRQRVEPSLQPSQFRQLEANLPKPRERKPNAPKKRKVPEGDLVEHPH